MGAPKGNLELGGRPILLALHERWRWDGPTMLVTAPDSEHFRGAEQFMQRVRDAQGGQGPLRGILTALENATTPLIVVAAVDMPCIERAHLDWTVKQLLQRPECNGVLVSRDSESVRQIEPFPSAYRRSPATIGAVVAQLGDRRRSVRALLDRPGFCAIDSPPDWPERTWLNLNTPQDLNRLSDPQSG
jgi:molybdopterin-guanine dinucleotide biosynthesis protein A